jgi:uncharacterized protein YutD
VILVGGRTFELIYEHKNGWNADAFKERYSEVLDRYDYIVGDWGYNQLRLKGFFREGNPKATKDTSIAGLQDYLQEYCNFGCAYFVLERKAGKGGGVNGGDSGFSIADGSEEDLYADAEMPEPRSFTSGLAGGHAFSDRKPYSWREHQSPVRLSGRKESVLEATRDAVGLKAVSERSGSDNRGRGEDGARIWGSGQRQNEGKGHQAVSEGAFGGERFAGRGGPRVSGGEDDDRTEKDKRGGGRRFHSKAPKHNAPNRGRGPGQRPGGARGEGGNRPENRGRADIDGGQRHAQRGNQQRAGASQQPRNN